MRTHLAEPTQAFVHVYTECVVVAVELSERNVGLNQLRGSVVVSNDVLSQPSQHPVVEVTRLRPRIQPLSSKRSAYSEVIL